MQLLPASPRKRRRLARVGVVLLAALIVVVLTAIFKRPTDNAPSSSPSRGFVYEPETPVRVTPQMRREINETLVRFVPAAVMRNDTMQAYELATPTMQKAASRDEWERGEIPVAPFRVRPPYTDWTLNYSIKHNVNVDLMLRAASQEKELSAMSYNVDLKRVDGAWRVESFYPVAQFRRTSLENGTKVVASYDFVPPQPEGSRRDEGKTAFVLVAFGIPALGLALVILVFVSQYIRNRRAAREFAAG